MATTLPRPHVEVGPTTVEGAPNGSLDVTIIRGDGKVIAKHQVAGSTPAQIVRDATEKLINDPMTAEALP